MTNVQTARTSSPFFHFFAIPFLILLFIVMAFDGKISHAGPPIGWVPLGHHYSDTGRTGISPTNPLTVRVRRH